MFALSKAADLNYLGQGGQQYRAFPFSKDSLPRPMLPPVGRKWQQTYLNCSLYIGYLRCHCQVYKRRLFVFVSPLFMH
jgi:hypothetical protein